MYPRLTDVLYDLFGVRSPFPLYSFGGMVAVAFLVAAALLRRELSRKHRAGVLPLVEVREKTKDARGRVSTQLNRVDPSYVTGTITILALVGGIAGAKLFHILENLGAFARDPLGMIFSAGGLTFYGGLIVAAVAIVYYVRKRGLYAPAVADAVAPGLLLAYGIGRIGCYLAGDGDWGVCSNLANKPAWLPGFLWSETFPRNVMGPNQTPVEVISYTAAEMQAAGMDASVCAGATGVFPTMLYEFAMCAALFGVLWALRKHPFRAGWLFALYLVFTGLERFVIEQIRINNVFEFLGMTVTQAEVISVVLMLLGAAGLALTWKKRAPQPAPTAA